MVRNARAHAPLHRSVAGARLVATELAAGGHEVVVVNLGCAARWWAKRYGNILVPTSGRTSVAERPLQSAPGEGRAASSHAPPPPQTLPQPRTKPAHVCIPPPESLAAPPPLGPPPPPASQPAPGPPPPPASQPAPWPMPPSASHAPPPPPATPPPLPSGAQQQSGEVAQCLSASACHSAATS